MTEFVEALARAFGTARTRTTVPLAPLTTFRVGGPADVLFESRRAEELVEALRIAHARHVPVTLLGGGSNVLIGDGGIRGLVIRPRGGRTEPIGDSLVRADAAVTLESLVRWTVRHGYAGLEGWSGTPGTLGGAIFGNAHWQRAHLGDLVETVGLARRDGTTLQAGRDELAFTHRGSRLRQTGEVLLWAVLRLTPGADPQALYRVARESRACRRRTQPLALPSAGCMFMNPDPARDPVPEGVPPSAGALLDRAGMKGVAVGGARVSTLHANFIVNEGGATAADIEALVERCRQAVRDRFGITLRDEVIRLGELIPCQPL